MTPQPSAPVDLDAEMAVLGHLLLDPSFLGEALALEPAAFGEPVNRVIFETVSVLASAGEFRPKDVVDRLNGQTVGDLSVAEYLQRLVDHAAGSTASRQKILLDLAKNAHRRRLIEIGAELADAAANPAADPTRLLGETKEQLRALRTRDQGRERFRLVGFDDLTLQTAPSYLVKGLIPATGIVVVWGPPKCGKSFWIVDLGIHVARGAAYRNLRTKQASVVYVALEGQSGVDARVEAIRQRLNLTNTDRPTPFYIVKARMNLAAEVDDLIGGIQDALGPDVGPGAIIIDTLNRSLVGSESNDEDMQAYLAAAERLGDAFSAVVAIVHHSGVDQTRPRGHTSLTGTADAQIAVKKDDAGNTIAEVEFAKDFGEGLIVASRLEWVQVGVDDDGEPISSCIVVEAQPSKKVAPATNLTGREKVILTAIREAVAELHGSPPASNHIPPSVRATTRDTVAEYARRLGFCDGSKPNSFRSQLSTVVTNLVAKHLIGTWNDAPDGRGTSWIWIAE